MDKEPIDKYGNGNCCPECGSIRITTMCGKPLL